MEKHQAFSLIPSVEILSHFFLLYRLWGRKESDMTEQLTHTKKEY